MILEEVRIKLEEAFPGAEIEIRDATAGHEEHNSGLHVAVFIVYSGFEGKSTVEQHQAVYAALDEELKSQVVHALYIKTKVK